MDIKQWDQYADLYDKGKGLNGDSLHNELIQPILDTFLGDYSNATILDAGCGNGFLTNTLAKKAKQVVGINSSEKLLTLAKKNINQGNASLRKVDLTKVLPFKDNHFDIIIANMVLQYLPSLEVFIKESARVLKESGNLLVIIDHPGHALFLRAQELLGKMNEKFITSDSYFNHGKRKKHSLWNKAILHYYHRPLSFYINQFTGNYTLEQMGEVSKDGEMPRILGLKWRK